MLYVYGIIFAVLVLAIIGGLRDKKDNESLITYILLSGILVFSVRNSLYSEEQVLETTHKIKHLRGDW